MTREIDVSNYRKLSSIEHILIRGSMYIGAIEPMTANSWCLSNDKFVTEELTYSPALLKLFDEILSNSVDEHIRSGNVKNIWVEVHPMTGEIVVKDDGGIPVIKHPEYGTYIPEMIFSELRAGSNFGDDDRMTAGMNGLGSTLVSIYSKEFKVDTCDGKKRFVQVFKNNLSERGEAAIVNDKDNGTTITFTPDYERLGCELDDDNIKKIERRVYDVAGCNPNIKVHFNGKAIKLDKFIDYAKMYVGDECIIDSTPDFEVCISASENGFQHVSFVNGVDTFNGGTHVEYVVNQIVAKIREFIKKKHKVDVKPSAIKQHIFLVMKCRINAPSFTSQTKEFLSTDVKHYGTTYQASDKFIKKVMESEVVQSVLDWVNAEKRREEMAELRKLNKATQSNNYLKRIAKFDDATSTKRSDCTLFLSEGDSAAQTIIAARDPKIHGVMPLKGKIINVRDISVQKLTANQEFQNIMAILGLKVGQKVESVDDLRFGRVCIAADQDADGYHIAGLFFNMLQRFWPELFDLGVVYRLRTPLIIADANGKKFEFFDAVSYAEWESKGIKHKYKYYKGLGGHNTKDFAKYIADEAKYMQKISVEDASDFEALDIAFDKTKADKRKVWLQEI